MKPQHKPKYELGDIIYDCATESHLLIEEILTVDNHLFYSMRKLETNIIYVQKAGPYDKFSHVWKVA